MREPGHRRDYIRSSFSASVDRALGIILDMMVWEFGPEETAKRLAGRASQLMNYQMPRHFDPKVKLDQLDVFIEGIERYRFRRADERLPKKEGKKSLKLQTNASWVWVFPVTSNLSLYKPKEMTKWQSESTLQQH